jgi:hypothetical protein
LLEIKKMFLICYAWGGDGVKDRYAIVKKQTPITLIVAMAAYGRRE